MKTEFILYLIQLTAKIYMLFNHIYSNSLSFISYFQIFIHHIIIDIDLTIALLILVKLECRSLPSVHVVKFRFNIAEPFEIRHELIGLLNIRTVCHLDDRFYKALNKSSLVDCHIWEHLILSQMRAKFKQIFVNMVWLMAEVYNFGSWFDQI